MFVVESAMRPTSPAARSRIALAPILLALALPSTARAGNDAARINEDGTVDFTVHYSYPPSPDDVVRLESTIRAASVQFCDATDGQLRFGDVTIASTSTSEATADVWILPSGLWARSTSTGFLLDDSSRIFITPSGRSMTTFGHEMGHAVLQLQDAYDEQSRQGYWGISWAIDPGRCSESRRDCVEDSDCFPLESCEGFFPGVEVPQIDAVTNTMMTSVFASSMFPRCTDTTVTPAVVTDVCLAGDIDCAAPSVCMPSPYYSELLTDTAYDSFVGDGTGCPSVNPGAQIRVAGVLDRDSSTPPFNSSSLLTASVTSEAWIQLELVDEIGDVRRVWSGSDHRPVVVAQHVSQDGTWKLHFLLDGRDIDAGTPGTAESFGEILIDFNGPPVADPFHGQEHGRIRVWNGQSFVQPEAPGFIAPVVQTFAFPNGAPPLELSVDVSGLYAIADMVASTLALSEVLGDNDLPQTGSCQASYPPDPLDPENKGLGWCDDDESQHVCDGMWNSTTGRWEATLTTFFELNNAADLGGEWDQIVQLPDLYGPDNVADTADQFHASLIAPLGSPQAEPGDCMSAGDTVVFDTRVDPTDAIVLLVDTSGSMGEELSVLGQAATRIDWARSSVGQIAQLVEYANLMGGSQELGLVTFATEPDSLLSLASIGVGNAPTATDVSALMAPVPALGITALADGLDEAVDVATATGAGSPSVIVFTDGQANVCLGGMPAMGPNCSLPQANQDAVDVIDVAAAGNPGVDFYLVPLGAEFGAGLFGKSAGAPGDLMLAQTGFEMPIAMLEAYLRVTGRSPITPRTTWAVAGSSGRPSDLPPRQVLEVPVEIEAGALHVSLTSLDEILAEFDPAISVRRPDGTLLGATELSVVEDLDNNIYRTIHVDDPEPGVWQVELGSNSEEPQHGYALAWTDNRWADCYAGTASPLLDATVTAQEVRATASWATPIEQVDYQGTLYRPNGTTQTFAPQVAPDDNGMARSALGSIEHQGLYRVEVLCDASSGRFTPGELPDGDASDPFVDDSAPGFVRAAATTFIVDNGRFQPLPAGDDCDGDGIANAEEGAWCQSSSAQPPCEPAPTSRDSDGDGILDACDEDSDADEIFDRDEPTGDVDGDGLANVIDPDSDGDGILDGLDDQPYVVRGRGTRCTSCSATLQAANQAVATSDYATATSLTRESMQVTGGLADELAAANPGVADTLTTALLLESIALAATTDLTPRTNNSTSNYIGEALQASLATVSLSTAAILTEAACAGM